MVKRTKTGGRPFPKGKAQNPGGRFKFPDDIKEARKMSFEDQTRCIIEVRQMTHGAAKTELEDDSITLGRRAIINAYVKLDYSGVQYFENRIFGKVQDNIDLNISGENGIKIVFIDKTKQPAKK